MRILETIVSHARLSACIATLFLAAFPARGAEIFEPVFPPPKMSRYERVPLPPMPPMPASQWFERDKAAFSAALEGTRSELMIAPVEVAAFGFDRAERSLIALKLADILRTRHGVDVTNVFAVERALGEGLRRIDIKEIESVAQRAGVRRFLRIFVGHDDRSNLVLMTQLFRLEGDSGSWQPQPHSIWNVAMKDAELPAQSFAATVLPRIAASLAARPAKVAIDKPRGLPALPPDINAALKLAARDDFAAATMYGWLASVAPSSPERARERLAEQSLIALDHSNPASAEIRILRARALLNLHSRPAALAAIAKPATPAERAFAAYLDGNLPDLKQAIPGIKNELLRAMAEFDLRDLELAYRVTSEAPISLFLTSFVRKSPQWAPLVARRFAGSDLWKTQENIELELLLAQIVPIPELDLETKLSGLQAMNLPIDIEQLGLQVFEHVDQARRAPRLARECRMAKAQCPLANFIDLVEASAIEGATKAILFRSLLQGSYDSADALANTFLPALGGNPDFDSARAQSIGARLRGVASGPDNPNRIRQRDLATAALSWEQGQSVVAASSVRMLSQLNLRPLALMDEYSHDIPLRDYWFLPIADARETGIAFGLERIRQSVSNVNPILEIGAQLLPSELAALKPDLAKRFIGSPSRPKIAKLGSPADEPLTRENVADQMQAGKVALEAAIRERPDRWEGYEKLGVFIVEEMGDYEEGYATFMRFPGFKKMAGYNSVELSNNAYGVGSMFFWRGHFDEARKLLKISADLDTGSAASISSKTRLDILDGKYEDAMKASLLRASRYTDAYAYRDYMGWLFAFGRGAEAWAIFEQFHDKMENPQVWEAADLGLRMESRTWTAVRDWLMSDGIRASGRADSFAQSESLLFNAMDRVPAPDFAEATRAIEDPPRTEVSPPPLLFVMGRAGARPVPVPPSDVTRRMPPVLKHGERVPSHQAFFADAYAELRRGNFDTSSDKFLELARRYPIEGHPGWMFASYTLPYFAWATAHAGDKYKIEAYLDANEPVNDQRFDFYLAKAFFTGARGDHKGALDFLKKAFDSRPYTNWRPIFTEYQWAEACDWLYETSGDERYRKLALDWARANQRTSPFFSWPYSMEAKLTTVANDRRRALGFALYLDPGSERIAKFSEAEKEAARQWFKANNPFLPGAHAERKTALR